MTPSRPDFRVAATDDGPIWVKMVPLVAEAGRARSGVSCCVLQGCHSASLLSRSCYRIGQHCRCFKLAARCLPGRRAKQLQGVSHGSRSYRG